MVIHRLFYKVEFFREQLCGTKALFQSSIFDVFAVLSRDALPFAPGRNMHFRVCLHDNNVHKTKMFFLCIFVNHPFTRIPENV